MYHYCPETDKLYDCSKCNYKHPYTDFCGFCMKKLLDKDYKPKQEETIWKKPNHSNKK